MIPLMTLAPLNCKMVRSRWLGHSATLAAIVWLVGASPAQDHVAGGGWREFSLSARQLPIAVEAVYRVDDVNSDGVRELAEYRFGSSGLSGIYCIDGKTGAEIWFASGYPMATRDMQLVSDFDGDGVRDLLVGTNPGSFDLCILSGLSGLVLWQASQSSSDVMPSGYAPEFALLGDLNGDGVREFAIGLDLASLGGTDSGAVLIYDGSSGAERRRLLGQPFDYLGTDICATGDQDGDQVWDLLVVSNVGTSVELRSGATGGILDEFTVTSGSALLEEFLVDLDGDFLPEILVAEPGDDLGNAGARYGALRCFSSASGSLLWEATGSSSQEEFGFKVYAIGDYDEDLVADLLVYSPGKRSAILGQIAGGFRLISGATGQRIRSYTGTQANELLRVVRGSASAGLEPRVEIWYSSLAGSVYDIERLEVIHHPGLTLPGRFWSVNSSRSESHEIDFGASYGGGAFCYLISRSGKGEWIVPGLTIPLAFDSWVARGIYGNGYPGFAGSKGTLDSMGRASVAVTLPAGSLLPLLGTSVAIVAAAESLPEGDRISSVAWSIEFVP